MTNQLAGIAKGTIAILPQLFVALVVLALTWLLAKLVKAAVGRALDRSSMRQSLRDLVKMLSGLGVWVLGIMSAAIVLFPNLTPASMLAGLGIGSVAIGFAFKDTFENFLAGIIILLRREMRIGDHIDCEELEGRVESIAIRETHIRQTDGQLVIVPNSILFKNPLTIRTDQDQRRTTIICGIAYDEDVAQGRAVIRKAVEACETVIQDTSPVEIFAQEFADSSINFEVTWWTGSKPVDIRTSRDEVVEAVKKALDDAGIEIPFPYRTMTFKEPLSIDRGEAAG
ncbi:MAG: mechanosensitive ion channel family protein [Anderseniella sp.]|nr:mechanosensitive ion channel family protein [Anderseniella sp.]